MENEIKNLMSETEKENDEIGDGEIHKLLWVDKYAPKSMIDLCSSEKINREVTTWVKEWDYIVFGHKYSRRSNHSNDNNHNKNKFNINNKQRKLKYSVSNNLPIFGKRAEKGKSMTNKIMINKNKKSRPEFEVLLFCGSPGTGKSTLAHIVANHCGYRPFEINASDDRNGKKLMDLIVNKCTTKPLFGDKRPALIIMDEIDGALNSSNSGDNKSAVDAILKIVKNKLISRPIICICNN